jgi:hypothetical protein
MFGVERPLWCAELLTQILHKRCDRRISYAARSECDTAHGTTFVQIENLIGVFVNVHDIDALHASGRCGRKRRRTIGGKHDAVMNPNYHRYAHGLFPLRLRLKWAQIPPRLVFAGQSVPRQAVANDFAHRDVEAVRHRWSSGDYNGKPVRQFFVPLPPWSEPFRRVRKFRERMPVSFAPVPIVFDSRFTV